MAQNQVDIFRLHNIIIFNCVLMSHDRPARKSMVRAEHPVLLPFFFLLFLFYFSLLNSSHYDTP